MKKRGATVVYVLIVLVLIVAVFFVFMQNYDSGDSQTNTQAAKKVAASESSDNPEWRKKASNDFLPPKTLVERRKVNARDFILGHKFDMTEFAKALGYTPVSTPESNKHKIYAMYRDEAAWFFVYNWDKMELFVDCGDGCVYKAETPIRVAGSTDYVVAEDQENRTVGDQGILQIEELLTQLATAEKVTISDLSKYGSVKKYKGPPKYYSNGLLDYRDIGDVLE